MTDISASHSTVRRWIEKVANDTGNRFVKSHAEELALTIRQVGEGGVVGAVLGAVDSEIGLDVKEVPLDLVLAVAGSGAAMYYAREEFSHDLRNVGSHSLAIFSFRKTKELIAVMKGGKSSVAGEEDEAEESASDVGEEDPIVQAARDL